MSATIAGTSLPPSLEPDPPQSEQNGRLTQISSRPSSPDTSSTEEGSMSPDLGQDGVDDHDDAQAVLQPAMSAAASHLTSTHTPALEKAAAMEKSTGGGFFDPLPEDDEPEDDQPPGSTVQPPITADKESSSPPSATPWHQQKLGNSRRRTFSNGPDTDSAPSRTGSPYPWSSGRTQPQKDSTQPQKSSLLRPSKAALESAFGPTRNRSRSAGQDALRKLQKAFPSFSSSSHLLPSFSSSFFNSSSDKLTPGTSPTRPSTSSRVPSSPSSQTSLSQTNGVHKEIPPRSQVPKPPGSIRRSSSIRSRPSTTATRPPILRRVTSDESILYHSLSRASSLGDDEQFQDVREMVNMRLQAIKESLPEVPNFKMPNLPKIHTPSFMSMNSVPSNEGLGGTTPRGSPAIDREKSPGPKPGETDLDSILEHLTGDIVIMGGFRGSVLRFAEPPHQQCWAPVKLGFNMRKVNLEVGLDDEDEERMEETIKPSGMLTNIGPIDISRKLIKKFRNCENGRNGKLRVWDYGYDWRLSPHLLSRKLGEFLEKLPSNQPGVAPESRGAMVIAHSLGGVITRHAVNQRPDLFSGVLYAGVPQRCINILGPLRNGDVVLLNEKLLTASVNFSMRTPFVFLPEDGFCFIDKNTQEEYPVDFYDPQEWIKWCLSPCVAGPALPALNRPAPSSGSPSLSSLFPTSLRARAESASEKWFGGASLDPATNNANGHKDRTIAPQLYPGDDKHAKSSMSPSNAAPNTPNPSDPERQRYLEYLTRTLSATKKFRAELQHRPEHQAANAYPPLALLYGKSTPTVYAAQVNGREGIPCADAYDDLLFRAGDGVVLAKESMLPEGYSVVKGGRVNTERGHITMLGDMEAVAKALGALVRGRRKGIGAGAKLTEETK